MKVPSDGTIVLSQRLQSVTELEVSYFKRYGHPDMRNSQWTDADQLHSEVFHVKQFGPQRVLGSRISDTWRVYAIVSLLPTLAPCTENVSGPPLPCLGYQPNDANKVTTESIDSTMRRIVTRISAGLQGKLCKIADRAVGA